MPDPAHQRSPAVERAATILEVLSSSATVMTPSELSRRTGIPRSSATILCTELVAAGLVVGSGRGFAVTDPDLRRALAKRRFHGDVADVRAAWDALREPGLAVDLVMLGGGAPTVLAHFGDDRTPGSVRALSVSLSGLTCHLPPGVGATYRHDRVEVSRRVSGSAQLSVAVSSSTEFVRKRGLRPLLRLLERAASGAESPVACVGG